MSPPPPPLLRNELSRRTAVLGLRLWVLVGIAVGAAFVLLLVLISLHLAAARRRRPRKGVAHAPAAPLSPSTIPPVSKEIQEVAVHVGSLRHYLEMGHAFLKDGGGAQAQAQHHDGDGDGGESVAHGSQRVHIEAGKGHRMVAYADGEVGPVSSDVSAAAAVVVGPEVSHLGWGHWYTLRELEEATAAFAPEHVVGEGGYGIVYRGVLADGYQVAVKNLLNNRRALPFATQKPHLLACASPFGVRSIFFLLTRCTLLAGCRGQAEREFKVEVEAIGRVRHKNLVRLLGYCAEGAQRYRNRTLRALMTAA